MMKREGKKENIKYVLQEAFTETVLTLTRKNGATQLLPQDLHSASERQGTIVLKYVTICALP